MESIPPLLGARMSLDVAMVSTYPPTQCGIATFARSLGTSMADAGANVDMVVLGKGQDQHFAPEIAHSHRDVIDLPKTHSVVNQHDLVILQHEFGIYGGPDGEEILDIIDGVKIPIVTVLHTVLRAPTANQRRVMQGILNASNSIVVMSKSAHFKLAQSYSVIPDSISVIPHGAPDLRPRSAAEKFIHRKRMLTWGLLSHGKGIEWGIRAIAALHRIGVDVEYIVAGRTHPKVLAQEGDRYRRELESLAQELNVEGLVRFVDDYLDATALAELIASADFYLLPYDNTDQVTSGVLVEALIAGGPVIATQFPHARELLSGEVGIVVPQQDFAAMAEAIHRIATDDLTASRMRRRSLAVGSEFLWSRVAAEYVDLGYRLLPRNASRWGRFAQSASLHSGGSSA
jgi:glycosyltransferase involved in cell wall biosynthesis